MHGRCQFRLIADPGHRKSYEPHNPPPRSDVGPLSPLSRSTSELRCHEFSTALSGFGYLLYLRCPRQSRIRLEGGWEGELPLGLTPNCVCAASLTAACGAVPVPMDVYLAFLAAKGVLPSGSSTGLEGGRDIRRRSDHVRRIRFNPCGAPLWGRRQRIPRFAKLQKTSN